MHCDGLDVKAYVLGEIRPQQARQIEDHLKDCARCRQAVQEWRHVTKLLKQLPQVEVPRRLVFVRDPVFQLPWWQRVWQNKPVLALAASLILAVGLALHGYLTRPQSVTVAEQQLNALRQQVRAEVRAQLEAERAQLLKQVEQRIDTLETTLRQGLVDRVLTVHHSDVRMLEEGLEYLRRQVGYLYLASAEAGQEQ